MLPRLATILLKSTLSTKMQSAARGAGAATLTGRLGHRLIDGRYTNTARGARDATRRCLCSSSSCSGRPSWHQTMLRIKDPKIAVKHYQDKYGMRLIDQLDFPENKFSLYFLATLPKDQETPTPGTKEAHRYLWSFPGTTLELTHNWGTEVDETQAYHPMMYTAPPTSFCPVGSSSRKNQMKDA